MTGRPAPSLAAVSACAGAGLVGRETLVEVLVGLWQDCADQGRGRVVVLTGDGGIGKTTLARALTDGIGSTGQALWGSCSPEADGSELWPWRQALCPVPGAPAALGLDSFASADGGDVAAVPPDRTLLFAATATALLDAARRRPVMLVLDDLHRADAGSLRLLRFLMAQLPTAPLLVVTTARDELPVAAEPYAAVVERATVLPVPPLDEVAVSRLLVRSRVGAAHVERAEVVHRRTGGNPFLVDQLIRLLDVGTPLADALQAVEQRRFTALPDSTRRVLAVCAVAADVANTELVANALDRTQKDVEQTLLPAVHGDVVTISAGDQLVEFTHDLHRDRALRSVDATELRTLNRRVAQAVLTQLPPGPASARRLAHLCLAGRPTAEEFPQLLGWLVTAATDAERRRAYDEASALWGEAAMIADEAGDRRAHRGFQASKAEALLQAGEPAHAREIALAVIETAWREDDTDVRARGALVLHGCGWDARESYAPLAALLDEAIMLRGARRDALYARLLVALSDTVVHADVGGVPRAVSLADEAARIAAALDDPAVLVRCLQARIDAILAPGTASERLALARQMTQAAVAAADPVGEVEGMFRALSALLELGSPTVHHQLDDLDNHCSKMAHPHLRWLATTRRAVLAIVAGDLQYAEQLMETIRELGLRLEEPDVSHIFYTVRVSIDRWRRGPVEAWDIRPVEGVKFDDAHPVQDVLHDFFRRMEAGDMPGAREVIRTRIEPVLFELTSPWQGLGPWCDVTELAVRVGYRDILERIRPRLLPFADTIAVTGGAADCHGPVSLYLGIGAMSLGLPDEARAHLEDAMKRAEELGAPLWHARAAAELSTVLRSQKGTEQWARTLADTAAATATRAGATAVLERLEYHDRQSTPAHVLTRDRESWTVTFAGVSARLPDTKGLRDLAQLLSSPGTEIAAAELVVAGAAAEVRLGADPVLDEQARAAYRARLQALARDEEAADQSGNVDRSRSVRREQEQLLAELGKASGLGGRARLLGDATERARKAVTARIKDATKRIETRHPALAAHLHESIHTGRMCSYDPTPPTHWTVHS